MRSVLCRSLGASALLLAAVPAFATIATYNTFSDWNNAVSNLHTIDFFGFSPGTGFTTYTLPPVQFSTSDTTPNLALRNGLGTACPGVCMLDNRSTGAAEGGLLATFSSAFPDALAFSIFTGMGVPVSIDIIFSNGAPHYTTTIATNNRNSAPIVFGVTSSNPILSIKMTASYMNGNDNLSINNFNWATALAPPAEVDTPESASLGYIGLGVVAMFLGKWRNPGRIRRG